jgi:polyisoprenoid-binding protein YceI
MFVIKAAQKDFNFKSGLMQTHYNENYVESEKFPKASFRGVFAEGAVKGALSIHGITQEISVPASLTQEDGNFVLVTSFEILLADYGVKIPGAVANKISNTASIQVHAILKETTK